MTIVGKLKGSSRQPGASNRLAHVEMTPSPLHFAILGLLRHGDMLTADELATLLGEPAEDVARAMRELRERGYIQPATAQWWHRRLRS